MAAVVQIAAASSNASIAVVVVVVVQIAAASSNASIVVVVVVVVQISAASSNASIVVVVVVVVAVVVQIAAASSNASIVVVVVVLVVVVVQIAEAFTTALIVFFNCRYNSDLFDIPGWGGRITLYRAECNLQTIVSREGLIPHSLPTLLYDTCSNPCTCIISNIKNFNIAVQSQ